MVIGGLKDSEVFRLDPYAFIIAEFYSSLKRSSNLDSHTIEANLLDSLRSKFGFVPFSMYQRRFQLFKERLQGMTMFFQPLVYLHPKFLTIEGWEALARDPNTGAAPVDLFKAAELWGAQFTIELDQYFLKYATNRYYRLIAKFGRDRLPHWPPVSINVYPDSLMSTAYYSTVEEIVINPVTK